VAKAAFEEGKLSEDQVKVLARHTPAHNDAEVAEFASHATVSQLSRTLGSYPFQGEGPKREERREVSFGSREDGSWGLRAILPLDEGLRVEKALEAAREAEFRTRHPEGEGSPFEISWSDALLRLADQSFDTEPQARPAERTQVLVHLNGGSGEAHLHLGPALSAELRRLFSCDASLRWVLEDQGKPLSYGRKRRTVPSHLRTLVEERDRGCRVPGCSQRRWLVAHHLTHWEDGGSTDPDNLACLCPAHHRAHHLGRLGIEGDPEQPEGLVFTDPLNGWVLDACGRPRPPNRPPREAAEDLGVRPKTYTHPRGERLDRAWVSFSEAPGSG